MPQDIDECGKAFLRERGYEIVMGTGTTPEILKNEIADCEALVLRTAKITREILAAAKKLKVISRYGVGYDNVDLAAARELGIAVTYSPVGNVNTVAEHTLGFIIAAAHWFYMGDKATRTGNWAFRNYGVGVDVEDKTLGVIGIGKIGSRVARKAILGLDMKVMAYDPYVNKDQLMSQVELASDVDRVYREADFVSIHVPTTPQTRGMIGAREFGLMKQSAYFINCSRGEIMREQDLIAALKERQIAGAALDVYEQEPPATDNPLFAMENVILSPHNAGTTRESAVRVAVDAARGIDDVLNGREPQYPVPFAE